MWGSRIIFQKVDKAKKDDKFIEIHSLVLINITCFEKIIDFFICEINFQFAETVLQLLRVYRTTSILIYAEIEGERTNHY